MANFLLYQSLFALQQAQSTEEHLWLLTCELFYLECGVVSTETLFDILCKRNISFIITGHINLFYQRDTLAIHVTLSPPLYVALRYIHGNSTIQKTLNKLKLAGFETHIQQHIKGTDRSNLRAVSSLAQCNLPFFDDQKISEAFSNIELHQALPIERFKQLISQQKPYMLAEYKRKAWLQAVQKKPDFSAIFQDITPRDNATKDILTTFIKRLKPTVKKADGTEQKQLHTRLEREPFIAELDTAIEEGKKTATPFQVCGLIALRALLAEGNEKDFLALSSIKSYIQAYTQLGEVSFNEAISNDSLQDFFKEYFLKKPLTKTDEEISYVFNKLVKHLPELELTEIHLIGNKAKSLANAQYVSYIEIQSVIHTLLATTSEQGLKTTYAQVLVVILGYFAGLRRGEMLRLRHKDICISNLGITIQVANTAEGKPKYNSTRQIELFIPSEILRLLKECLVVLEHNQKKTNKPILQLEQQTLSQRQHQIIRPVSLLLKEMIHPNVLVHSLRHSNAFNLLMQYLKKVSPATFYLCDELTNSAGLFNDDVIDELTCKYIHEACENVKNHLGHKSFATTLQSYLAGSAFYSMFSRDLSQCTVSREQLVSLLQKDGSPVTNSATEAKISHLVKQGLIQYNPQNRTYMASTHALTQVSCNSKKANRAEPSQAKASFPTLSKIFEHHRAPTVLDYVHFISLNEAHPLHAKRPEHFADLVASLYTAKLNLSVLTTPSLKKSLLHLKMCQYTLTNRGRIQVQYPNTERSQIRYLETTLKACGLWGFSQAKKDTSTRPPRFIHTFDPFTLKLIIHFLEETLHGKVRNPDWNLNRQNNGHRANHRAMQNVHR